MSDAPTVFDAQAAGYEAQRRRLIPPYDDFYGGAVDALALATRPIRRVLDLGAGTGLLARRVADALPEAEITLLDAAPAMLAQAELALGAGARYRVAELDAPLPEGPWDAVVSALAIHHLDDAAKRRLLRRAHAVIAPGGVFVNAEQVTAPSRHAGLVYDAWHERASREAGAAPQEWSASMARKALDRCATVADQLVWLDEAGFADADCVYKHHCFAVLAARRP